MTNLSNIIIPEVFDPYVENKTKEISPLFNSGILAASTFFDKLAENGGSVIKMPYFSDLFDDDEVLSDQNPLVPNKISAKQDLAVLLMRGKAWSSNDLAKALSGTDPLKEVANLTADFWARKMQKTMLSILKGIFDATGMEGKVHDISALAADKSKISGTTFIDAMQKMGDAKEVLCGVLMHSATEAQLRKNNLIESIPQSENKPLKYFMGKRVIVDDNCPVADGVYTTYLFGKGAFAYGNGYVPVATETSRDSLGGNDILINRKHYIMHPRGVKWIGSPAGTSPSNEELALGTNWEKAYSDKSIRIVKFVHKL